MAILKTGNVWFNASGSSRLEYQNDNVARVIANAVLIPVGTNANRPTAANGMIRFNVDQTEIERVKDGVWSKLATNTQVEGAYAQANVSYNYAANQVQLIANSAYAAQNTTYTYAANTVMRAANSAYAAANSTWTYAANTVMLTANTAYASANLKANIDSQTFTGGPQSPTAANTTSNTMIATTQFVQNEFGRRLGRETIWLPASSFYSTGSPSSGTYSTGGVYFPYLAFDSTTAEYAFTSVAMPKSWDLGNLVAKVYWGHPTTTTNFGVVWQVAAAAFGDGDTISNVYSGNTVADTGGAIDRMYVTSEITAIDPGNTQALNDILNIFIARVPSNGSDTMAVDAYFIGMHLYYTTNAWNDT